MFNKLKQMIGEIKADFADLRYEINHSEKVVIQGGEIRGAGSNTGDGYVLRVYDNGALTSVNFINPADAELAVKKALENVKLIAARQKKKVKMVYPEVIKDSFRPCLKEDPRTVSLQEKTNILKKYSELLFSQPKIVEVQLVCEDVIREKYYVNSLGSEIFEELVTCRIGGMCTSKEGDLSQSVRISFGGSDGFWRVRDREQDLLNRAKIAYDLLQAEPVKAGTYKAVLCPSMAGVFTHEAFGHFSEGDIIENLPSMRVKMPLGAKLGNDILNIVDDATIPGQLGFYKYDDEGTPVRRVNLMTNGVLTGRLHDRFTAAEFDEPISGHAIAENFTYEPIVRMGNIFITPGEDSFDELLKKMGDGLYLCEKMGGQTAGENFTFGANWGYKVEKGKIAGMIRDINLVGNLFETLKDISAIGNDFTLGETGGCGKGQLNIRSNMGGPHILVDKVTIGGV